MSNSKLVSYTKISPNSSNPRNHKIDKITIHHMAGNLTVETCGSIFADPNRDGSSNYGIGSDGRVGMYVEEKNRAWTSSSPENDHRAVTIEVANDGGAPDWHVSDKALAKTIDLCVDICKRNGIERLNFTGDKTGNLTMHKWFAATACPGPYLESKFPYIAQEVNKRLSAAAPKAESAELYRVRKSWKDAASQIGAFTSLEGAKSVCKAGYTVYDSKGNAVYPKEGYTLKQFVTDVQKAIGAAVDGIAGPETLSKTPTISAKKNSRHAAVKPIQKRLYALGYTQVGAADGDAGPKFTKALKAYQKDNGCVADGEATAKNQTWKCLLGLVK